MGVCIFEMMLLPPVIMNYNFPKTEPCPNREIRICALEIVQGYSAGGCFVSLLALVHYRLEGSTFSDMDIHLLVLLGV